MPDPRTATELNDLRAAEKQRSQGPLDESTSEVLTRVYLARRLRYQMDYYLSKEREYMANHDNSFRIGAIIMTMTSLLAAIGTQEGAPNSLRLLTAILPAMAAMVTGFRQLYQWDKQAQLFKDTVLGLKRAELTLPDLDQTDTTTTTKIFPSLVKATESVFEEEVSQWGQLATGKEEDGDGDGEAQAAMMQFAKDYGIDIYNEDGTINPTKLSAVREILAVSRSRKQVMAPDLSVSYPTVASGEPIEGGADGPQEAESFGGEIDNANENMTEDTDDTPPKL